MQQHHAATDCFQIRRTLGLRLTCPHHQPTCMLTQQPHRSPFQQPPTVDPTSTPYTPIHTSGGTPDMHTPCCRTRWVMIAASSAAIKVLNDQSSGSCRVLRSTGMSGHPDPASAGEYQISLSTHSRQTRQGLMLSFSDSGTVSCRAPRLSSPVRCQQHPQTPLLFCLLARTVRPVTWQHE
jgi:hypothetical protein